MSSAAYDIYTYGSGEALSTLFNGIVAAVGDDNYTTLIRLAGAIGLAWVLLIVAFKPDNFSQVGRWFIGYLVIFNALLVPKINIAIVDRLNPAASGTVVQNVPWGLGYFAHLTSSIGDGLTRLTERNFSSLKDLKYHQTGTVMASSLVARASQFRITNPDLASNMREFIGQCVFYDVLLGKYTLQELFETPDIWSFVKSKASPARAFRYQNQIYTCKEGIPVLEQDWQKELDKAALIYGQRFFAGRNPQEAKAALLSYLPISYQYLTSISENASNLMRQNMMINAIQEGLVAQGATSDASAAIQSFAVTRAEQQQKTAYAITGQLAARWLPIMKNVFEALFYGAFLFIFLAALLPAGVTVLKTYLMSLFWLQTWAPLYAVLNLLMNIDAKIDSLAAASLQGGYALTLATASGIAQVNSDTAVLAGYLSMSIPFIAFGIIKGGVSTFTHLAGYIGGVSQSSATQASEEPSTGNINLGNTSMSNHSLANTSGFKHDTNAEFRTGAMTYQTESGASITTTSGGLQSITSGPAISTIGTQVNLSESIRSSATQQSEHSMQAAKQSVQETSTALTSAYRSLNELSKYQGTFGSSSTHQSTGESAHIAKDLAQNQQLIDDFAKNNGITSEQSASVMASVAARAHMGYEGPVGGASLNLSSELQGLSSARHAEISSKAEDFVKTNHLGERYEHLSRAVKESNYTTGTDQGGRLAKNISTSLDRATTARESTAYHLQQAESYRTIASQATEKGISLNANASQEFVDWLKVQPTNGSHQPMGIQNAEHILHHQPALAREYANQFIGERTEQYLQQVARSPDLQAQQSQQYQAQTTAAQQLQKEHGAQANQLRQQAMQDGLLKQQEPTSAQPLFDKVNEHLKQGKDAFEPISQHRQTQVESNLQKKGNHLSQEAGEHAIEKIKDTFK